MKQYIVDAFTNAPFSGNPAAVCVLPVLHRNLRTVAGLCNWTGNSGSGYTLHKRA